MKEKNKFFTKEKKLVVFQDKKIRRIWHNEEWYFSISDVIEALTESTDPTAYWRKLKQRLKEEGNETVTNCHALKMLAIDGKMRLTDVANTKQLFRLIQSIPSRKAEPFKKWLAQVGYERIQEIENPELGQNRIREYYKLKGYSEAWIEKRIRGIAIRQELTDKWQDREIQTEKEFAILTDEISKATFGKTTKEYKEFKSIQKKNKNLRDHMNDWELIFTMFGEKATTDITQIKDSQGLEECQDSANKGGNIAKRARKDLEKTLGKTIITKENPLTYNKKKQLK